MGDGTDGSGAVSSTEQARDDVETVPRYDDAVLSARDVETGYGDLQILFGVDVDVFADEIVLVFGPNGAGKSTFLKATYRLLPLWAGTVEANDVDVSERDPGTMVDLGINYVPQRNNVFPNLSVRENLEMGGVSVDDVDDRIDDVMDLFPRLRERTGQMANTLSGGERQMLALGRGLMTDPEILFVDEPTAQLAPQLVDQIFEHLEEINERGTAILMVEQNIRGALEISDRAYVLHDGENRFEGAADRMLESERIRDLYMGRGG